jgi:nucleotide-binding universal stress UspA family protein
MTEIVVGYDGSDVSRNAVTWAAREAALHERELVVAHAVARWLFDMPETAANAEVGRWARAEAHRLADEAAALARREAEGITVTTRIIPGDARPVLLEAARNASMLVVGGRGEGGFVGLLLGSVAHGVAGRSTSPVVVVQGPLGEPAGELVVGVDGSPEARPALEAAFAEAAARGATLRAVHCWQPLPWTAVEAMPYSTASAAAIGRDVLADPDVARQLISEAVADAAAAHPDVKVVEQVVENHPVRGLTSSANGADLLVVGRSGSGGFTEVLLGSVSRGVLHHAPCPVMIVPA